jgi:HlyD family secretion protein
MAADAPLSRPPQRRVLGVTALVLVVVGLAAWAGWRFYEDRAPTDRLFASGSIQATEIDVSPKVAGRIIRLVVNEGDRVRAGQVLAELEPQEATAQVMQAQAAVAQAEAQVAQGQQAVLSQQQATIAQVSQAAAQVTAAGTGIPQSETALAIQEQTSRQAVAAAEAQLRAAEAQVGSARSTLVTARNNLSRQRTLFGEGAVAATQVDAVQAAYDAAVAQNQSAADAVTQTQAAVASARASLMQVEIQRKAVEAARANLAQAEAGLRNAESGYTVVAQRRQALAAAQAALAQTRATLDYVRVIAGHNVIAAPRDAVVQTRNVEEGEVVAAGTPLYTLIDLRDIWLRAYVPEDQIARVKVGQIAHVSIDSFPGRVFEGRVEEISSRGEFTPGNVQTREDRVKLAFSVKIRLTNSDDRLKPGMPADAEIVVGTEPGGPAR